tara:strand:- start:448 stop:792 length:345 start_codon:yes stop_codon:yes gene_type:complete
MALQTTIASSSSSGGGSTTVNAIEKPVTAINIQSSSSGTIYTVASGYYFKGYICQSSYNYPYKINSVEEFRYINLDEQSNYAHGGAHQVCLASGSTIQGPPAGNVEIHGNEYLV